MSKLVAIRTNIYRRKTTGGKTAWMVRWRSPESMRWKTVTGGRTRQEAEVVEARVRMLLAQGKDPEVVRPGASVALTVSELIDRFYQHPRFKRGSASWRRESRVRIEMYIRPELGQVPFCELRPQRIYDFYLKLRDKRGLGRPSICKTHTLMALMGDVHAEVTGDPDNVRRRLREFSQYFPKRAPKREINFLTPEEIERLLEACAGARQRLLRPLCQFLAYTGLRRSEALNLKWTDIDLAAGYIHVRQSKNGKARIIPLEANSHARPAGAHRFGT